MGRRGLKDNPAPNPPTNKEVADAIRRFSDRDLIQVYQLAMAQLETIAGGLRGRLSDNIQDIVAKRPVKEKVEKKDGK